MSEQVISEDAGAEESAVVSEMPVGEQLRLAREARGLLVADIAQTLKLGPRQVEALECGDWHGLPGQTFIRGFVRNYARLVQVDPAPLMVQLGQVLEKPADNLAMQEARPASMPNSGAGVSRRDRIVMFVGAGLVVLAGLAYFLIPADLSALRESTQSLLDSLARKDVPTATPAQVSGGAPTAPTSEPVFPPGATQQQVMYPQVLAPAEAPAPSSATQQKTEAATSLSAQSVANQPQMRFLFDKESWIEVRDRDNKVIFSQRLGAGTEQVVSGQGPLSLTVGYAPGVRLFWHGQAVDLAPHTKGDVARLVLE
jgi:cytoskeleton protein RodZ